MNILIVRLGALGDVVHAVPAAAALRKAFPGAGIDWLVEAKHRDIVDLVTAIDRTVTLDSPTLAGWTTVLRALRRTSYDIAIDLQGLLKSAVLARGSGATRVVGFSASYARERLARLFYTDAHDPGRGGLFDPRETRHVVEINLGLLETLGLTASKAEFPIDHVDSDAARFVGQQTGGRYALLNPGAAWPNKCR